jgi:hypothetical protein
MRLVSGFRLPGLFVGGLSVVLLGALFHDFIICVHDPGALIVCIASLLVCALVVFGWIKPAAILSFLDDRLFEEYAQRMERANAGRPFPPLPPVHGPTDDISPTRPIDHPLWDKWLDG